MSRRFYFDSWPKLPSVPHTTPPLPLPLLLSTNVIFLFQHSILPGDIGKTIKSEICGRIKLKFNKNIIYWRKRCEKEVRIGLFYDWGVVNYGSGNIKPKFDDLLSVP